MAFCMQEVGQALITHFNMIHQLYYVWMPDVITCVWRTLPEEKINIFPVNKIIQREHVTKQSCYIGFGGEPLENCSYIDQRILICC